MNRSTAFWTELDAGQAHLRILGTTDLHAHILPYDYYADRPSDAVGFSRVASLIEAARAGAENSLLFDNGDFLQGTPLADYVAHNMPLEGNQLHPMIAAMNVMDYDAMTLGNHEFNYGLSFLAAALRGAQCPRTCANIRFLEGTSPFAVPYVLLDRQIVDGAGQAHKIRIGVVGFVPPQVTLWDKSLVDGRAEFDCVLATARAVLPSIKAEGADLVVALCHGGITDEPAFEGMENACLALAEMDEVDVLLAGHHHLTFPGRGFPDHPAIDAEHGSLHGKPVVMAGACGSHLGQIDLAMEKTPGGWQVAQFQCRPIPIADPETGVALASDHKGVIAETFDAHHATLSYIRQPVGQSERPLHSFFAQVAPDLSLQVVADAQRAYAALLLDQSEHARLPLLSAVAPFKAGGRAGPSNYVNVAAGDLAICNIADLYIYPNNLRAVCVTGLELRNWLERSAGVFERIVPGIPDQPLLNPAYASYNFDVIYGVDYRIDLTQPARFDVAGRLQNPGAQRILPLSYRGTPVRDDARFVIATNTYRAYGGGEFPGALGDNVILEAHDSYRDALIRHVRDAGSLKLTPQKVFEFAPIPNTSVVLETGPGAREHLDALSHFRVEDLGDTTQGFAKLRLHL